MTQFTHTTQPIHVYGVQRFKNQIVLHPGYRLSLDDIATVIIDQQSIQEHADVVWVFFWDRAEDVGKTVACAVAFWRRNSLPADRAPKPVPGFISTDERTYRDGVLTFALNREPQP